MAHRIELTVDPEYVSWGIYEGIREFLQNAKDEENLHSHLMTVRHDAARDVLQIRTAGSKLSIDTLLLGRTGKRGNKDAIGEFGEGYKLGCLGLIRQGCTVKIWTGEEMWEPKIVQSANFKGCEVLAFDIHSNQQEGKDGVLIEIFGITQDAWEDVRSLFLFLDEPVEEQTMVSYNGRVLLNDAYTGRLYVKGIFVQKLPGQYQYGYDLHDVQLDRDRQLADSWSLRWELNSLWRSAIDNNGAAAQVLSLLASDSPDTASVVADYMSADTKKALVDAFHDKHGADALPVASVGVSAKLAHVGKRGVVMSKDAHKVLSAILGDAEEIVRNADHDVVKNYDWNDLTVVQQAALTTSLDALAVAERASLCISLDQVRVVEFRGATCAGQYRDGDIYIAVKLLDDVPELVATLAHEFAHSVGADGTVEHEREIERILSVALAAKIWAF